MFEFVFQVKRTEADIEGAFLAKSGTLGSAAARAETDFALTYSNRATSKLVTETLETVRLPISNELFDIVPKRVQELVRAQATDQAGPTVVLSSRSRLNITASRVATSINGTLVNTMSGQGSAALQDLFSDVMPLKQLITNGHLSNGEIDKLGDVLKSKSKSNIDLVADELTQLTDAMGISIKERVAVPFETIPIKYSNWGTHQAVMAVCQPRVIALARDGTETVMSVVWYDDIDKNNVHACTCTRLLVASTSANSSTERLVRRR